MKISVDRRCTRARVAEERTPFDDDEMHHRLTIYPIRTIPHDRLNLVYLTLVLHGVGFLLPWNMFINAKEYFVDYKLSKNYTGSESEYVTNFMPYIGWASQVPNLAFNWINVFLQLSGNLTTRIVWCLFIEIIVFAATLILAMVDSAQWPGVFFWMTMASVFIINMASGIYQNSVYGMAAKLPFKYTAAVILGSNVSGTFVSLISIATTAFVPSSRTSAIYYFTTALIVLATCVCTYIALPLNRFYRYHETLNQTIATEYRFNNRRSSLKVHHFRVLQKCFLQCFNVFMLFFVTLTIFPTVQSDIARSQKDFFIGDKYYGLITCFLTYNLSACVGSLLSTLFPWPSSPRFVIVPVMLRLLFIPFFLLCNYQPSYVDRALPILVANDWAYWGGAVLFGLTGGYLSAVSMIHCSMAVSAEHASTAGMFGAASLITGVFTGVSFSSVMAWLVAQ